MNKLGFSLIECMAYCLLFALLMIMLFKFAVAMQVRVAHQSKAGSSLTNISAAHDVFAHDMRQASSHKTFWKKTTLNELIWLEGDKDIGWHFSDNKLFRIEGSYSSSLELWTQKTKSLVADNISSAQFLVLTDTDKRYVTAVQCVFNEISRITTIRNRELR